MAQLRRVAGAVAAGLGAGHCPFAPGTAGALLGLASGALLLHAGRLPLSLAALAAIWLGVWAVQRCGAADDPGWVVIDEVAGQWVALLGLAHVSWTGVAASFLLFRLLDIWKPGPVGWADQRHDAWGVMADDVVAGLIAAALLFAARSLPT